MRKSLVLNLLVTQDFHVIGKRCKHLVTCIKTIANGNMFTSLVTNVDVWDNFTIILIIQKRNFRIPHGACCILTNREKALT